MSTKDELLNKVPEFTNEDFDREYRALYIIPTTEVSKVSAYPQIIFVAVYDDNGVEKHVRFENGSDVLQMNNEKSVLIPYFHIDCSYTGMVRLFGFRFTIGHVGDTFVIHPVQG